MTAAPQEFTPLLTRDPAQESGSTESAALISRPVENITHVSRLQNEIEQGLKKQQSANNKAACIAVIAGVVAVAALICLMGCLGPWSALPGAAMTSTRVLFVLTTVFAAPAGILTGFITYIVAAKILGYDCDIESQLHEHQKTLAPPKFQQFVETIAKGKKAITLKDLPALIKAFAEDEAKKARLTTLQARIDSNQRQLEAMLRGDPQKDLLDAIRLNTEELSGLQRESEVQLQPLRGETNASC